MNANIKLNERIAILATLDPASVAPGTVVSTWVPAANFHSLAAILQTGALGASATVDAKLRQAQDATGTNAKDVTGKAVTQLVAATGNNKQVSIELRGDDLDANNGFGFIALSVTVGTAASIVSALLVGANPRYAPASAFNQAAVAQVV